MTNWPLMDAVFEHIPVKQLQQLLKLYCQVNAN